MSTPEPRADGWWRRNRWALAALPLALALTIASAGDRVRTMWWEQDLRRPTTAAPGATAAFHQVVRDGLGSTYPIDVQVRLDEVGDARSLPDGLDPPPGTRAVQVDLTLAAEPDVSLVGCHLAVRDAAGTRYDYVSNGWGAWQPTSPCVPEDATGPWPSLGDDLDDALSAPEGSETPRPATWSVSPVLVVPADVEVTDVVLWWQMPQHVLLEVGR
ncbi:hypothetical protein Cfla_1110 [Cellulomonas flavigena DSM 20109]|uniref:Uncharacterized protein n=1 Tax=Cellulomonas flavigena (strain ATCC 482 / DSM 20109 / BCRC 11376 / JCM 18109 / NBRC 3775 / NCIMB 8073 / NRS 134) TaxID=446466 RepID=D5ULH2_CELFN|nr:hypothetical protein [Cellulomonas flavigena]ADG74014.1 hypothetical protein Cfla_1110 [Cellulomonas flavigena DSM 20109]